MKIYTKTGDKGKTSLFNGTRVYKNNPRVEAYGTIDELNSIVGIIVNKIQNPHPKNDQLLAEKVKSTLHEIQNDLLDIGSFLANPMKKTTTDALMNHLQERVSQFELLIDEMTSVLPELTHFILPGGSEAGALLHLARTVCRRTERITVGLSQKEDVPKEVLMYFNRLSDLFFTMSRLINFKEKQKEIIWRQFEK